MVDLGRRTMTLLLVAATAGCAPARTAHPTQSPRPSTPYPSSAAAATSPPSSAASSPAASAALPVPPVSAQARAADLIDIRSIVPDAVVDLRYATSNNFARVRLYPADARCLVHASMAAGLAAAADRFRRGGQVLVLWDCYRPHAVQTRMFQIVPDPTWVARPGRFATSHEAGRAVDATLAEAAPDPNCPPARSDQGHCLLDMGTGFDDFTARAHAFATDGVSPPAQANRLRLRDGMRSGGLTVYPGEWWHFNGPGAAVQRALLDAPPY